MRGSIEEAEELQEENKKNDGNDNDGERQGAKPASRERQKEIFGRLPASDKASRGHRQMDYSPYESKHQHHHQNNYDGYDDYNY